MKDWEWFALGLIPFMGMPIQVIRYIVEDRIPTYGQLAASAVAGQGVAYGLGKLTGYKVSEHLAYYRLQSLGFQLSKKQMMKPGPIWRPTFAMRMSAPLLAAGFVGMLANELRTDEPDRYRLLTSYV